MDQGPGVDQGDRRHPRHGSLEEGDIAGAQAAQHQRRGQPAIGDQLPDELLDILFVGIIGHQGNGGAFP